MKSLVYAACILLSIVACDRPVSVAAPVLAQYGVIQVRFIDNHVARDSAFPPGVYDVPLDVDRATAFDTDSVRTTVCTRISPQPHQGSDLGTYWRFQCDTGWDSRGVVFVVDTQLVLNRGAMLEWNQLGESPPLAAPKSVNSADLHSYAQVATPAMLGGKALVSAAWFTGEYPPRKEMDVLRGDSITFGHYVIRDRVFFIGESPAKPSTYFLRAQDTIEVGDPLEWAFLPSDASEKDESQITTIWETANGYLVRVLQSHDHEGFGVDEFTNLYLYESGRWRLYAKADRFRAY